MPFATLILGDLGGNIANLSIKAKRVSNHPFVLKNICSYPSKSCIYRLNSRDIEDKGITYILLCKEAKQFPRDSRYNIDEVTNKTILEGYGYLDNFYISPGEISNTWNFRFRSKAEVYQLLSKTSKKNSLNLSEKELNDTTAVSDLMQSNYETHLESVKFIQKSELKKKLQKRNAEDSLQYNELVKKSSGR